MKKLLIFALLLNAVLVGGRIFQELPVSAQGSGGTVVPEPCGVDPTKYSLDTNDDKSVDLSDAIYFLDWFFSGGEPPRVCLAQSAGCEHCLTDEQAEILGLMSIVERDDGQGGLHKTILISGANVQIVNGSGQTDSTNGTGNLIVGYQEQDPNGDNRTGSHNVVVGQLHDYSSYGGLVVGQNNRISGTYATVTGGHANVASGDRASVSGGALNVASGPNSSITGGEGNKARGKRSTVSGGRENIAGGVNNTDPNIGYTSSISGGLGNNTTGSDSSVSGGFANQASGGQSSISGGSTNSTTNDLCSVSGGILNKAIGTGCSVSGGNQNIADGTTSSVSGGEQCTAKAESASVSGGQGNQALGPFCSISGGQNNVVGVNPFVGKWCSVSGGLNRSAQGNHDWAAGSQFEDL